MNFWKQEVDKKASVNHLSSLCFTVRLSETPFLREPFQGSFLNLDPDLCPELRELAYPASHLLNVILPAGLWPEHFG